MSRHCHGAQIARSCGLLTAATLAAAALNAQQLREYAGAWQGEALFYFIKPSGPGAGGADVLEGAIDIKADGIVAGTFPAAGCTMRGSSANYVGPTSAMLDLRVADCDDARFDWRFTGTLIMNPMFQYASLRLSLAIKPEFEVPSVSAVLRRPVAAPAPPAQLSDDAGPP